MTAPDVPDNTGVPLWAWGPQNAKALVVAWMSALRRSGVFREDTDPLPFTLITHVTGTEDIYMGLSDPVISVHTLCDRTLGFPAADAESDLTHRRMLLLGRTLGPITLTDDTVQNIDYMKVFESPKEVDYGDSQIIRLVGRYVIGLSYAQAAS